MDLRLLKQDYRAGAARVRRWIVFTKTKVWRGKNRQSPESVVMMARRELEGLGTPVTRIINYDGIYYGSRADATVEAYQRLGSYDPDARTIPKQRTNGARVRNPGNGGWKDGNQD